MNQYRDVSTRMAQLLVCVLFLKKSAVAAVAATEAADVPGAEVTRTSAIANKISAQDRGKRRISAPRLSLVLHRARRALSRARLELTHLETLNFC